MYQALRRERDRLDHQPLFGKGARGEGRRPRHERAAEMEPKRERERRRPIRGRQRDTSVILNP